MPPNVDAIALRKLAGVKHIIETEFKHDAMKGVNTGEGRLKIRLNNGETAQQVQRNLLKAGIMVKNHVNKAGKKLQITHEDGKNQLDVAAMGDDYSAMGPKTTRAGGRSGKISSKGSTNSTAKSIRWR